MATTTICAVATPPGRGGVGIIRLSGPEAVAIAQAIVGDLPAPRVAALRTFRNAAGDAIDEGLVLYFPAPHSMTGEAVVELQGHGGPVVLDRLLQRLLSLGAVLAEPGEFSQRAFINGRMDLTRAEAIADLISAGSEAAARAAMRSLQGSFASAINGLVERLLAVRVQCEAHIDFADEPLTEAESSTEALAMALDQIKADLVETLRLAESGQRLQAGLTLVIAGRPNAGKSSLLNALAGRDAAIVTDIAGTTRDVIDTALHLDGLPLRVLDTAGLRDSDDQIEQEGVRRARAAMEQADRILLVVEEGDVIEPAALGLPAGVPITRVLNKIDLTGRAPGVVAGSPEMVAVSALTGAGLDALREHLFTQLGHTHEEPPFIARRRHLLALQTAAEDLDEAIAALNDGLGDELVAESLRQAQDALGRITGTITTEDLLGEIFSTFCIGK